jgi:hypothetical protein
MTLDDELTRLEQRAVKYGYALVTTQLREKILKYVPVKSAAFNAFSTGAPTVIPAHVQFDQWQIFELTKDVRHNIARLAAERLTK